MDPAKLVTNLLNGRKHSCGHNVRWNSKLSKLQTVVITTLLVLLMSHNALFEGLNGQSQGQIQPSTVIEDSAGDEENPCLKAMTCQGCIRIPGCVWCKDHSFEAPENPQHNEIKRCNKVELMRATCTNIQEITSTLRVIKNVATQKTPREDGTKVTPIHISPQQVNVKIGFGHPINVSMTYLDAEDKPLDLYYIMDLSATMKDDKETVALQGKNLVDALQKITSNVQIGFGSFIDKPIFPFVSHLQLTGKATSDKKETGSEFTYAKPYGFKNHLKMTVDTSEFIKTVNQAAISQNLDSPEGTLDALMQAMACNETIGWRKESRKLLVVSTDGPFHIAGDGKLAGIIEPNDEECHMDGDHYTHSTILDYPSISQINSKVKDTQVNVIFAVTTEQVRLYEKLKDRIDSSIVVELTKNSSNMVEAVRNEYLKIRQSLSIKTTTNIEDVKLTYYYRCNPLANLTESTNRLVCDDIAVGASVNFTLKIELLEGACKSGGTKQIKICPFGLCGREDVVLDLELICGCSCETEPVNPTLSARFCSSSGNLSCGTCDCDSEHSGRYCQCPKALADSSNRESNCTEPDEFGNPKNEECSGRGVCSCKQCDCTKAPIGVRNFDQNRYNGKYCQYDTQVCIAPGNGKVCSNRGSCIREKCECNTAQHSFKGPFCDCPIDESMCIEPTNTLTNKPCSGRGTCECISEASHNKECVCKSGCTGRFCHNCPGVDQETLKTTVCDNPNLQECVQCWFDYNSKLLEAKSTSGSPGTGTGTGTGTKNTGIKPGQDTPMATCQVKCSNKIGQNLTIHDVSVLNSAEFGKLRDEVLCVYKDKQNCDVSYRYFYGSNTEFKVVVAEEKYCIPEPPFMWIIIGVVGAVLLIGILLLLIWKVCTHIHDKREYERFEQEKTKAQFGQRDNPLYEIPTTTVVNPVHNRRTLMNS